MKALWLEAPRKGKGKGGPTNDELRAAIKLLVPKLTTDIMCDDYANDLVEGCADAAEKDGMMPEAPHHALGDNNQVSDRCDYHGNFTGPRFELWMS